MSRSFDWGLLRLPPWTSLSAFGDSTEEISERMYSLGSGVYAVVSTIFGSTEDPYVSAILGARSRSIALAIRTRQRPKPETGQESAILPREVSGFAPLTFGGAVAYETRRSGCPPQVSMLSAVQSEHARGVQRQER